MTMKHTPTPWHADFEDDDYYVRDADDGIVADCRNYYIGDEYDEVLPTCAPNVAFIVRACNAHDDLVAALEAVQEMNRAGIKGEAARKVWAQVRAALAKARGEA